MGPALRADEAGSGFTCRCNDGFTGNGFIKCTASTGAIINDDDHLYIFVIVLIILLFIGLLVILIFFLCRRRILDKTDNEPLVPDGEDPYDKKWEMVLTEKDVPPPYSDISEEKVPPTNMTTFFVETEVGTGDGDERVVVKVDDEDFGDEVDVVQGTDNPAYDGIDNPTYDMVDSKDAVITVAEEATGSDDGLKRAPIGVIYKEPEINWEKKEDEAVQEGGTVVEPTDDVITDPADEVVEPTDEVVVSTDDTVEEHEDAPNTVTATVTTPNANLTINLNINVPK